MNNSTKTDMETLANTLAQEFMSDPRVQEALNKAQEGKYDDVNFEGDEWGESLYYAERACLLHKLLGQMNLELAINY